MVSTALIARCGRGFAPDFGRRSVFALVIERKTWVSVDLMRYHTRLWVGVRELFGGRVGHFGDALGWIFSAASMHFLMQSTKSKFYRGFWLTSVPDVAFYANI